MIIQPIGTIGGGQDGAIWGHELFRMDTHGRCRVYDLRELTPDQPKEIQAIAEFMLDRADVIVPHCNAVCWGRDFFAPEDEYPLLYANIYNNYAKEADPLLGVCCVYRIQRDEQGLRSTLVQLIEIGFCEDTAYWRACEESHGPRPYGNFVIDREAGRYYAFVMRNEELGTAYFQFDIPSPHAGTVDPVYGMKRVVLTTEDLRASFTCPYHRFIQGAIAYGGRIYSTEGFHNHPTKRPAIRIISPDVGQQVLYVDLMDLGYLQEPEMIDFYQGRCYYSDAVGNLYLIDFEEA